MAKAKKAASPRRGGMDLITQMELAVQIGTNTLRDGLTALFNAAGRAPDFTVEADISSWHIFHLPGKLMLHVLPQTLATPDGQGFPNTPEGRKSAVKATAACLAQKGLL